MINPATARVWAVCEEGAAAVPEAAEAAPEEEAVGPEEEEEEAAAVPEAGEAVGWVMKRPMNTATTRMLVITPNVIKASFHTRNRIFRRPLCGELSKLVLSGCASSEVNTSRMEQLLSVWLLIRPSPSSTARLY
jgi:hypothetical protein